MSFTKNRKIAQEASQQSVTGDFLNEFRKSPIPNEHEHECEKDIHDAHGRRAKRGERGAPLYTDLINPLNGLIKTNKQK